MRMDGGNILYIILVIAYVIYSIYKATKRKQKQSPGTKPQTQPRIPQQKRYEQKSVKSPQMQSGKRVDNVDKYRDLWTQVQQEIEKELNRGRMSEPAPKAEEAKVTVRDYDDDATAKKIVYDEKAKGEGGAREYWYDKTKLQTAVTGVGFEETEISVRQKDVPARELMERLHNPQNLREAVILSEILNAKY